MKRRIVSSLLMAFVTILLWLYLEAESLTQSQQDARVTFVSPTGAFRVTTVGDDWNGAVSLRLEGSQAALTQAPRSFEVEIPSTGVPGEEGEHTIDLRAPLRASRRLQRAGVNLIDVSPQTVRIRVEALETLGDVEIRADLGGVEPVSQPTVEPARATVTGPRALIEQLRALPGGPHVLARPEPSAASGVPDGQTIRARALVDLPASLPGDWVTVSPREAAVSFAVRSRTEMIAVPPAPVQLVLPPAESGRFRVEVETDDAFVREITVSGPSDLVEQIRTQQARIVAVLWLASDELERRITSKAASFALARDGQITALPAGLAIRAPDTTVRFSITPTAPPPETAPATQP